jgi:hypothetical protein
MGFVLNSLAATAGFVQGLALGSAVLGGAYLCRRTCQTCNADERRTR